MEITTLKILQFKEKLDQFLSELPSDLSQFEIDHICYRPSTLENYEQTKRELLLDNEILTETLINRRPIATFKLKNPIEFGKWRIPLIEVPAPKIGGIENDQFDHIEFIVGAKSLQQIVETHNVLNWDISNINAQINADISLAKDEIKIKYHQESLEKVISKEKIELHNKNKNKVIIFDLDGTLVHSQAGFTETMLYTLQEKWIPEMTKDNLVPHLRHTYDVLFNNLNIPQNQWTSLLADFARNHDKFLDQYYKYLGVDTILQTLMSEGFTLALWTARDLATTTQLLERFDIKNYFKFFQYFEKNNKPIPHTDLIEITNKASNSLMIGDTIMDYKSAMALKIPFLDVQFLKNTHEIYNFLGAPYEQITQCRNQS